MDLTPENKNSIDSMSYESLLSRWRNAPAGNPWFQGETLRPVMRGQTIESSEYGTE